MPSEDTPQPVAPFEGIGHRATWTTRVMDRGENFTRRILAPLRPRVSLASGSVLVLLTLFLPIGYNTCGSPWKGYELVQGSGHWPTFLGIMLSDYFGPAFYGFVLLLAAWGAVFTAISCWRPGLTRHRSLNLALFAVCGTLSLFLITDAFLLLVTFAVDNFGTIAEAIASILIVASCVLPGKFWPKAFFWKWFGALVISGMIVAGCEALKLLHDDQTSWVISLIMAIYGLVPLALWLRGLAARIRSKPEWVKTRQGLVAFYLPAALGNLWFFYVAWREGIWGFVPCWFGLHLMSLGYLRLAKTVRPSPGSSTSVPS